FSPPFHFLLLCSTQPKRKLFPYTTLFRSKQSSVIGITISHGFEWNTKSIIEAAWQNGKKVCVPKCQPKERKMDFYFINNFDQLEDRKSTRLNSSHVSISYAVFCLKKKKVK